MIWDRLAREVVFSTGSHCNYCLSQSVGWLWEFGWALANYCSTQVLISRLYSFSLHIFWQDIIGPLFICRNMRTQLCSQASEKDEYSVNKIISHTVLVVSEWILLRWHLTIPDLDNPDTSLSRMNLGRFWISLHRNPAWCPRSLAVPDKWIDFDHSG